MLIINRIKVIFLTLIFTVILMVNIIGYTKAAPVSEQPSSLEEITTTSTTEVILTPPEDVNVTILTDEYVMPAAELATTKTNPDIIIIENKYIKMSVLPNRGRLIFDYLFKPTGNNELFSNKRPSPVKIDRDYVVEFGGYYLSIPWNPRARQPYDLEYELIEKGPAIVKVYVWGEDPMNSAFMEAWIIVEQDASLVQIETKISNKSDEDIHIELSDYAVVAPGGGLTDNSHFIIPTSEVIIEQSKDNWMGMTGDIISWPSAWSKWSSFEQFGLFNIKMDKMLEAFVAINNSDAGDTLIKLWEPADFFDGLRVWSWGKNYKDTRGAEPTANFENYTGVISIPAGKSIDFITYFYTLKDMQNVTMANTTFTGRLDVDKQIYKVGEDQSINIQSQIGSSKDYRNINLQVLLTDFDGVVMTQFSKEEVSAISPTKLYNGAWKINLNDKAVESGEYIVKLELLDANNVLIFTIESIPFLITK